MATRSATPPATENTSVMPSVPASSWAREAMRAGSASIKTKAWSTIRAYDTAVNVAL